MQTEGPLEAKQVEKTLAIKAAGGRIRQRVVNEANGVWQVVGYDSDRRVHILHQAFDPARHAVAFEQAKRIWSAQ